MVIKQKVFLATGKRKKSIARATIRPGKGVIRINSINLDALNSNIIRMKVSEPLMLAGDDICKKLNANIRVVGGGWHSQAEAVRLALAKGILGFTGDKALKKKFLEYDRHLLVADTRRTEPQKPYRSAARAKRQKSKR